MNATQRVSLGTTKQALVISDIVFDEDGFAAGQRSALVPIDPSKDPEEMLAKAKLKQWEIYGEKNRAGLYEARVIGTIAEGSIIKETARSSHHQLVGDDVIQAAVNEGSTNSPRAN